MGVPADLEEDAPRAVELCRASHARLEAAVEQMSDEQSRRPSRLPDWTVGHVLTHLARNADGHVLRLEGALRGEDVPRYPGGQSQRNADIAAGAGRPLAEIAADLGRANRHLEQAWALSIEKGWPHPELRGDDTWPTSASPVRRLSEVEIHHVDLGAGYEMSDWPEEYVAWELPRLLVTLPARVRRPEDARDLVGWLSGRSPLRAAIELDPW
jgi:maleylpyruvate isomerase